MSRYLPLILFTVFTNAAAQILLKRGMMSVGGFTLGGASVAEFAVRTLFNPFVMLSLVTFVISMLSHLIVLSRVELSYAYPFLSLAYVVVTAYAFFVFREDVGAMRLLGIGLICFGTICIARS